MQANIHPHYHKVKVVLPDGREYMIGSAYGKKELYVDVIWDKHPAWTQSGSVQTNQANEKVAQFNSRYGNLNLFGNKENN
ncbi:MAG: 50S ribosomal protein L31 [Alphaproteobacteria bacterium]|nr:50S ribosomal protein L31 [Alphaproteobacteria bacterium]